jgi:hypothetical protein
LNALEGIDENVYTKAYKTAIKIIIFNCYHTAYWSMSGMEGTVLAAKICDLFKVFPFKRFTFSSVRYFSQKVPFIRYFLSKAIPFKRYFLSKGISTVFF